MVSAITTQPVYGLPGARRAAYDELVLQTDGVLAYWPLDDDGTTLRDRVAKNDLTLTGTYSFIPARFAQRHKALSLGGAGSASGSSAVLPQGAATRMAVWWSLTTATGLVVPFSYGANADNGLWEPILNITANLWSTNYRGSASAGSPLIGNDGRWHMWAMGYDGSNQIWSEDGAAHSTQAASGVNTIGTTFTVGKDGPQNAFSWTGYLSGIALFNRVLGDSELARLANAG